jgi:hypothetical protein
MMLIGSEHFKVADSGSSAGQGSRLERWPGVSMPQQDTHRRWTAGVKFTVDPRHVEGGIWRVKTLGHAVDEAGHSVSHQG